MNTIETIVDNKLEQYKDNFTEVEFNRLKMNLTHKYKLQNGKCLFSGIPILPGYNASIDRIIPESSGGINIIENLCWAEFNINRLKKSTPVDEFFEYNTKAIESIRTFLGLEKDFTYYRELSLDALRISSALHEMLNVKVDSRLRERIITALAHGDKTISSIHFYLQQKYSKDSISTELLNMMAENLVESYIEKRTDIFKLITNINDTNDIEDIE